MKKVGERRKSKIIVFYRMLIDVRVGLLEIGVGEGFVVLR